MWNRIILLLTVFSFSCCHSFSLTTAQPVNRRCLTMWDDNSLTPHFLLSFSHTHRPNNYSSLQRLLLCDNTFFIIRLHDEDSFILEMSCLQPTSSFSQAWFLLVPPKNTSDTYMHLHIAIDSWICPIYIKLFTFYLHYAYILYFYFQIGFLLPIYSVLLYGVLYLF